MNSSTPLRRSLFIQWCTYASMRWVTVVRHMLYGTKISISMCIGFRIAMSRNSAIVWWFLDDPTGLWKSIPPTADIKISKKQASRVQRKICHIIFYCLFRRVLYTSSDLRTKIEVLQNRTTYWHFPSEKWRTRFRNKRSSSPGFPKT